MVWPFMTADMRTYEKQEATGSTPERTHSPARCTGVRPYSWSVESGDAPWLSRVWTQSAWPRRAARAKGVRPAWSLSSTSRPPRNSTCRA